MNRLPKPLFFGILGGIGCLVFALIVGEPVLALLLPPPPQAPPPPPPPPPPRVDVLFVVDTTGSMQSQIDGVRQGVLDFADELGKRSLDSQVGLLAFRDRLSGGEEPEILQFDGQPFTNNYKAFRERVGELRARGGGRDREESALDALVLASEQPFRAGATKVILLITDAPPLVPDKSTPNLEAAAVSLKQHGIDQLHLVCRPEDRDAFYKTLQEAVPGEFFDLVVASKGAAGFARILPVIGDRIATITIAKQPAVATLVTRSEVDQTQVGRLVIVLGLWSASLAVGTFLALLIGQNAYLRRPLLSRHEALRGVLGSAAAGMLAGALGQMIALPFPTGSAPAALLSRVLGWTLLGALVGAGMSLFVKNLRPSRALAGGAIGGFIGVIGFSVVSFAFGDVSGRLLGAAILGFCIGVMVALMEAAFRRYWLEVSFGPGEVRAVNLGDAPVSIGSDSKICTVWIAGVPPVALTYLLRDGHLTCSDPTSGRSLEIQPGDCRTVGKVSVLVRGAAAPAPAPAVSPAMPPVPAQPPARPVAATPDRPMAPSDPPQAPRPVVATPPRGTPGPQADGCPSCGRHVSGAKGTRYCMICDVNF